MSYLENTWFSILLVMVGICCAVHFKLKLTRVVLAVWSDGTVTVLCALVDTKVSWYTPVFVRLVTN